MNYYIIDDKIIGFSNELDSSIYCYKKLDKNQSLFYELNRKAELDEILNCKLNELSLDELKLNSYRDIKLAYDNKISEGYYDKTLNIRILLEDVDRSQFVSLLIQLDNSEKLGSPMSAINIMDYYNNIQTLGSIDYRGLIARYGEYYIKVWGTKSYAELLVSNIKTKEDLTNIDINLYFKNI